MNDKHQLAERLGKVEHFKGLALEERLTLIQTGRTQHYEKNRVLFSEEEPSAGMFVLLSGQVQLCRHSSEGQLSILSVCDPVIMFNEVSALDGGPNPVTAIATLDSTIWQVSQQVLQDLLLQYPRIALGLLRVLAARNRQLINRYQDLSFYSVLARCAKLLHELSDGGKLVIDRRKQTNYQLAARIATVPEAFSRALRVLRERKAIHCNGQVIQVSRPDVLLDLIGMPPIEEG